VEGGPKHWSCGTEGVIAVQHCKYTVPLPKDLPSAASKILKLPEFASGTTVNRLGQKGDSLVLTQSSCAHGITFGDRFYIQHTHAFRADRSGQGVEWRQWTRFEWTKPLPWTHSFIKSMLDSRGKAETTTSAPVFAQIFLSSAA